MKKVCIWSSDIDLKDWQDFLAEQDLLNDSESDQYDAVWEVNTSYLDDERDNLKYIDIGDYEVIGIVDLGLWDGRRTGYKLYDSLSDILYSECDDCEWFVDGNTLCGIMRHHDGTNYVKYYLIKKEWSRAKENFLQKIYNNEKITKSMLYRNCRSAGKLIRKFYGA